MVCEAAVERATKRASDELARSARACDPLTEATRNGASRLSLYAPVAHSDFLSATHCS